MKKIISLLMIFLTLSTNSAYAQAQGGGAGAGGNIYDEYLKDVYIVAGAGVGGAVLGLSTLSFVDEPSEHLKNIVVGGAIGIILGVGIVAYGQATKSSESYRESARVTPDFDTLGRVSWHQINHSQINTSLDKRQQVFNYAFSF